MIPYQTPRGRDAFRALRVEMGVPRQYHHQPITQVAEAKKAVAGMTLGDLSRDLGYPLRTQRLTPAPPAPVPRVVEPKPAKPSPKPKAKKPEPEDAAEPAGGEAPAEEPEKAEKPAKAKPKQKEGAAKGAKGGTGKGSKKVSK
jgi:outer membrane biosynthesis protein TonB